MRDLETLVAELEQDRSLCEPARLRQRVEALDRLEAYLPDVRDRAGSAGSVIGAGLHDRAGAVYARLEAANRRLCRTIRREIRQGAGRDTLLRWARGPGLDGRAAGRPSGEGYDYLDVLVAGVLRLESPGSKVAELPAEMVPYQPTPARHIFDLIGRAAITEHDVLVDLGSGLGHVPLLVSICTHARSVGIELEAAYVESARRGARALNLTDVAFTQQDARSADLSSGTVFYLFTPFVGTILRTVLDSLRREGVRREVRVCTLGPCTAAVADEPWLEVEGTWEADRVAVFRSCA